MLLNTSYFNLLTFLTLQFIQFILEFSFLFLFEDWWTLVALTTLGMEYFFQNYFVLKIIATVFLFLSFWKRHPPSFGWMPHCHACHFIIIIIIMTITEIEDLMKMSAWIFVYQKVTDNLVEFFLFLSLSLWWNRHVRIFQTFCYYILHPNSLQSG